jgi:hypothetical protein
LGFNSLHQRSGVDAQEESDADQQKQTDATARNLASSTHPAPIFDMRALFSTFPAQLVPPSCQPDSG